MKISEVNLHTIIYNFCFLLMSCKFFVLHVHFKTNVNPIIWYKSELHFALSAWDIIYFVLLHILYLSNLSICMFKIKIFCRLFKNHPPPNPSPTFLVCPTFPSPCYHKKAKKYQRLLKNQPSPHPFPLKFSSPPNLLILL